MEASKPINHAYFSLIIHQLIAIDHTRTFTHTEGVFQCLHCQFGRDESETEIFTHMALNHPHEFAYICKRVRPQKLIELDIVSAHETIGNSTSIEYALGTATAEARSYEGDVNKLNSENLVKASDSKERKMCLVLDQVVSVDE